MCIDMNVVVFGVARRLSHGDRESEMRINYPLRV